MVEALKQGRDPREWQPHVKQGLSDEELQQRVLLEKEVEDAFTLIQAVFEKSDKNSNGLVEAEELADMLIDFSRELERQAIFMAGFESSRNKLIEHCRTSIQRFGMPGETGVDLGEFIRMLSAKPWKEFLPQKLRGVIPFVLSRYTKRFGFKHEGGDSEAEMAMYVVLDAANKVFQEVDLDEDGMLDDAEMVALIKKLRTRLGLPAQTDLAEQCRKAVDAYSQNRRTLTFDEFVIMCGYKPWISLLPPVAKDAILMLSANKRAGMSAKEEVEELSFVDKTFQALKSAFYEADTDGNGNLSLEEVCELYEVMCNRLGVEFSDGYAVTIAETFPRFAQNTDGRIYFSGFARLMNTHLWKPLLPEEVQQNMRQLILRNFA